LSAIKTTHVWSHTILLPNQDEIIPFNPADPFETTIIPVRHPDRFRIADQIQVMDSREVMLVICVYTNKRTIQVLRGYGGTSLEVLPTEGGTIRILGNAAIEGGNYPGPRFSKEETNQNYTQVFAESVEVFGLPSSATNDEVDNELSYHQQCKIRQILRELEGCVINGESPDPDAGGLIRRTMRGIIPTIKTNRFLPGVDGFPEGNELTKEHINTAIRLILESSHRRVDTIVVNVFQKKKINSMLFPHQCSGNDPDNYICVWRTESDPVRVMVNRWIPSDTVLLIDSTLISVPPLSGRFFQYKQLERDGNNIKGEIVGEYTLDMRNENAHGIITGLATK